MPRSLLQHVLDILLGTSPVLAQLPELLSKSALRLTSRPMICIIGIYHGEAEGKASEGLLDRSEPSSPPAEGVPLRHRHRARPPRGGCGRPGACRRAARGIRRLLRRRPGGLRQAAAGRSRGAREARVKYLLDTDTCIYALKQNAAVLERMLSRSRADVAVSAITEAELRTGAAKSSSPVKTMRLVENFLQPLTVVEFTSSDAVSDASVRAKLERAGTPIGPFDTLIAAQAVGRKLILVSNNQREFGRVFGLRLENWTQT